jgi:outer membrane protein assembly factor BamB
MRRTALLGALASLASLMTVVPTLGRAATPCVADWPMFQHDAERTAAASCTAITTLSVPTLKPRWFLKTNGDVTAEPAVAEGLAYVGDGTGVMRAIDMKTGTDSWSFDTTRNKLHVDRHNASYGRIDSSAAVADVTSLGPTVFFAGGGTVYAVDARNGTPRWATDVDPANPTSTAEVESSPVVWSGPGQHPIVFVGMDTNEDRNAAVGGVLALDASTGALLWKYDAEIGRVVHSVTERSHSGTGCGDVWSSPALDAARKTLFFGIGNCNLSNGGDTEWLVAISAVTGRQLWRFAEPTANHNGDNDFGGAPVLTRIAGHGVVVQAGKSGWVYVVDRASGRLLRQVHVAQGSDIGGFIGSVSVAVDSATGHPVLYGDTAIPAPEGSPDSTVATDPGRLASLHAVDLVTGKVRWHAPAQTPSYAPVTTAGGVVFAPDTTQFAVGAYQASDGLPIWHMPLAAAASSGVAVAGDAIVFGAGTYLNESTQTPPQITGVWCFEVT